MTLPSSFPATDTTAAATGLPGAPCPVADGASGVPTGSFETLLGTGMPAETTATPPAADAAMTSISVLALPTPAGGRAQPSAATQTTAVETEDTVNAPALPAVADETAVYLTFPYLPPAPPTAGAASPAAPVTTTVNPSVIVATSTAKKDTSAPARTPGGVLPSQTSAETVDVDAAEEEGSSPAEAPRQTPTADAVVYAFIAGQWMAQAPTPVAVAAAPACETPAEATPAVPAANSSAARAGNVCAATAKPTTDRRVAAYVASTESAVQAEGSFALPRSGETETAESVAGTSGAPAIAADTVPTDERLTARATASTSNPVPAQPVVKASTPSAHAVPATDASRTPTMPAATTVEASTPRTSTKTTAATNVGGSPVTTPATSSSPAPAGSPTAANAALATDAAVAPRSNTSAPSSIAAEPAARSDTPAATPSLDAQTPSKGSEGGVAKTTSTVAVTPPEKFAASRSATRADFSSRGLSLSGVGEKKSLNVDGKRLTNTTRNIGTDVANGEIPMSYAANNKVLAADPAGSLRASFEGRTEATSKEAASVPVTQVQASRLVHEIRDIAERVSSVERNSVEVRFDFSESERLSVRVEYRDGTVHTTFRSNSSDLCDAISREWTAQAGAPESKNYRLAEPVFTSNDGSQHASDFSAGADSGQSRSSHGQQPGTAGHGSSSRFASSGNSSTAAASARPAVRPDTSLHLHTFA